MNVLKDGAASIYGARAANGVIIVTTKSGSYAQQKATLSLDVYSGFSTPTNLPDLMNAQQHRDMTLQSFIMSGTRFSNPVMWTKDQMIMYTAGQLEIVG